MTKENECYAYFTVDGSFDPAQITQSVGIAPTSTWRLGDLNPRTHYERKFSRWNLRSRLEDTASLEEHIADVLNQLDANSTGFRKISVELKGTMQLVAYFHRDYPGLNFKHDLIERLAEYSLGMDFDFYYLYSDRREDSI
jgi:hypothetical protein